MTESDLIVKSQTGDSESFGGLYDLYSQKIFRYIYYRVQHRQIAEDLTSTVFTKALQHIRRFNSEKGNFSSWVYRIAHNTVIDHYRTSVETDDIETIFDLADDTNIERDIEVAQKLKKVEEYLKILTPEQRNIVLMRVWDGLPYQEIAHILGKSESSCRVMFSRTMQKLTQTLGPVIVIFLFFIRSNF